jgi:hypothetical protein
MFHLLYKEYFNKNTRHIFLISVIVFVVLNIIENVIHYNIGRQHDVSVGEIKAYAPSEGDWVRIIVIMTIFAILQGLFTMTFSKVY